LSDGEEKSVAKENKNQQQLGYNWMWTFYDIAKTLPFFPSKPSLNVIHETWWIQMSLVLAILIPNHLKLHPLLCL